VNAPAIASPLSAETLALPHNQYHAQTVSAAKEAAIWAALTGIELLAIKAGVKHGDWLPWVEANCAFGSRTATNYMKAGQRALKSLQTSASQPSRVAANVFAAGKARIAELLDNDGLAEQRAALIAAIKPAKAKQLTAAPAGHRNVSKTPKKPGRPVTQRPLFSSSKELTVAVERWHHTPAPIRHAFYDANRAEILAYLTAAP
jgi:hypothetical protein